MAKIRTDPAREARELSASHAAVEEVVRFNADRDPRLVKLKFKKMAASAFAFFRGSVHLLARAWPEFRPTDVGPATLICGDLHLENFGAFRGVDGVYRYDINDFDEAIVAPGSFDIVRCATSALLAAEDWELSPVQAATILWSFLENYRGALTESGVTGHAGEITPENAAGPIARLLGDTALGTQEDLLKKHTHRDDGQRRIDRSKDKHPDVDDAVAERVKHAVQDYGARIQQAQAYQVLDVTGRLAGIGSLGLPRFTVLIAGDGGTGDNRLLDVKQQRASAILSVAAGPQRDARRNEAERVVQAQRQLQAAPPVGLGAIEIDHSWYRVREMIPEESRSGLDRLAEEPAELEEAVELAGRLTAWSHWRGVGEDAAAQSELIRWAQGPGLEASVPTAIRFAAQTKRDHKAFKQRFDPD